MPVLNITKKRIQNATNMAGGYECVFYQLSAKQGIKLYPSKKRRNKAYDAQKQLARVGLSPRVYGTFKYGRQFGYVTEVVRTVQEPPYESKAWKKLMGRIDTLANKVRKHGFVFIDCHAGNVGYIGRRMVLLDTGHCSFDQGYSPLWED